MITIVPVYPTLLSIYADRGNVRVLEQRCAWRGIPCRVEPPSPLRGPWSATLRKNSPSASWRRR